MGSSNVWSNKLLQAGFTPLLQASQDGKLGVVKLLVEHNCISGIALDKKTSVRCYMQFICAVCYSLSGYS